MLFLRSFVAISCLVLINSVFVYSQLSEDDPCRLEDGTYGQCAKIKVCPTAQRDIREGRRPKHCGFEGQEPIVCCRLPIGAKAKYYCNDYYRVSTPQFIVGGTIVKPKDYQHMVALGYGDHKDIKWLCGGSLISREYVLTAAHCANTADFGPVRYARLGVLNLVNTTDDESRIDFNISKIIRHPNYKSPAQYHDIALLKLSDRVIFGRDRKPACVNTEFKTPENAKPIATGWGLTEYAGVRSEQLLEVPLVIYENKLCRESYAQVPKRKLPNGIVEDSQLCAGGEKGEVKDTCQGDSGGPLQIKHPNLSDFYTIIGVTSFGKACGIANSPGVYTRVSHYIPWIENIVWRNDTIYLE